MSNEEQDTRPGGSVPNAFGNALAWKWTRQMPATVRRTGLPTLLYALRAMANPSGELRFADRKAIRIQDIAKAACCREKDARRYLEAAIRAGVVGVRGERKRGTATLYVLLLSPVPDWTAAEEYLRKTARDNSKRPALWQQDANPDGESSGHSGPNHIGPLRPELTDGTQNEVRATPARWSSGHSGPIGSGHSGPNNPGIAKELPQELAEVSFQPQLVGAPEEQIDSHEQPRTDPAGFGPCARCGERMLIRPGRDRHAHCTPATERNAS